MAKGVLYNNFSGEERVECVGQFFFRMDSEAGAICQGTDRGVGDRHLYGVVGCLHCLEVVVAVSTECHILLLILISANDFLLVQNLGYFRDPVA